MRTNNQYISGVRIADPLEHSSSQNGLSRVSKSFPTERGRINVALAAPTTGMGRRKAITAAQNTKVAHGISYTEKFQNVADIF